MFGKKQQQKVTGDHGYTTVAQRRHGYYRSTIDFDAEIEKAIKSVFDDVNPTLLYMSSSGLLIVKKSGANQIIFDSITLQADKSAGIDNINTVTLDIDAVFYLPQVEKNMENVMQTLIKKDGFKAFSKPEDGETHWYFKCYFTQQK